jgi:polo-like kinase 1
MDNSNQSLNDSVSDIIADEIEERIYKFNGDEIIKKYIKGKFLGKGGFAKCYELRCLNNKKIYAAKIVSKNNLSKQSAKQKLKSEIKIHKSLFHSHIVKFEHVFEDNQNVYILLELCKNKTLNELIKKRKILTELEVRYYLDQILKAVKFMHKNKIIHRDLKLGNLFLSENLEIKIGDFGLATTISYDGERRHTICGTPNYIAPEILEGKATGHSFEVDFWALGVIVYTLLIGRPPFETEDVKETYKRIHNNSYSFPNHVYISPNAKDFIQKILLTNPVDRLNVDKMRGHPFMSNSDIPKSLPLSTVTLPPDFQFYRKFQIENKKISCVNDLSLNNSSNYNRYLEDLRTFALSNVNQVKCEMVNENILIKNQKDNINLSNKGINMNNVNYFKRTSLVNTSLNKENHVLLKNKKQMVNPGQINYITQIVDYLSTFGVMYIFNNNLIGIYYNDKSTIFKFINSDEFNFQIYQNKRNRTLKNFNSKNLKDVPSEIRMKLNVLINYEKYILNTPNEKNKLNLNINNKISVYVRKVICTDLSYIFKLSNNIIQVNSRKFLIKLINLFYYLLAYFPRWFKNYNR